MELSTLYPLFLECSSVTTDSRHCPQDSLFIALKGESFDGNAFAKQALSDGCTYAIIDDASYAVANDERYILVESCLTTLQELAHYHRRQLGTQIIGITGTNGKTTTKELLSAVLSQSYHILYTQGNLNNHIGVPLTLLRLKPEHELAVIEMGANHPGEIKELCEIAEPDLGMITNVGKAHLEGFGSFEGVIQTKGELYSFLRNKNATVFIHHENTYLANIAKGLNLVPYGSANELYVNGHTTGNSPFLAFEWKTGPHGELHRVQTQLIGEYNLPNALAAIAIGQFFEIDAEKINAALTHYTPQNNRSQLKETADNTLIIDAYNANPTSMLAALQNFHKMEGKHKMLILGDMRELGIESAKEHQKIIDYIETCHFDRVVLVGDQFAHTHQSYATFPQVEAFIHTLDIEKPRGYLILIKGSNGIKLSSVVEHL